MPSNRVGQTVQRLFRSEDISLTPPIDVYGIARRLKIEVVPRRGLKMDGQEVSGFLLRLKGRAICVVNGDHHTHRKRFTLAHEIGHFLLHPKKEAYVDWSFYARDDKSSEGVNQLEIEANAFAAELLMPRPLVHAEVPRSLNVVEDEEEVQRLARHFRVSQQAMTHRLTNLGLLGGLGA